MKSLITPIKFSAVLIYAAKSLGIFVLLMVGIFAGLMIVRNIDKRSLKVFEKQVVKNEH